MMSSPRLGLAYVQAGQAQKHVTVNEALATLDTLVQLTVDSASRADPPSEPEDGAVWAVPTGALGAWTGEDGRLATWSDGAWVFRQPRAGDRAYVRDVGAVCVFEDGPGWRPDLARGPSGSGAWVAVDEELIALSGDHVDTTISFPDRAIILAVSVRVVAEVTGPATFSVGLAAEPDKFGALLSPLVGASNIGVVAPTPVYAAAPVRISADGGTFTGGAVRVSLVAFRVRAPDS